REELGRSQPPLDALLGELGAGDAGAAAHVVLVDALETAERAMCLDDRPANAAIAYQEVAAQTDPMHGHVRRQPGEELGQLVDVRGAEIQVRRPTHVPGGMTRHRLVTQHARCKIRRQGVRVHGRRLLSTNGSGSSCASVAGNSAATLPMLPAPMVTTTSPSRTIWISACGSSSTFSTKTGSTRPWERTARHTALPSALAIGASPAA